MTEKLSIKKEDVKHSTYNYFKGDTLATDVWISKYVLKNDWDEYMEYNPDDMHKRISKELHRVESKYPNPLSEKEIYELLKDFKYIIPGGSNLYGIGNNHKLSSLGNCFVVGNNTDSYGGIFLTDQEQTQLMKMRAGVGHDISHLRPKGASVSNAAGSSVGVVPFMERFSNSTREVSQEGRRGALMLSISIDHPDVIDFIKAKEDLTKVTGANISVKVTKEFMEAVENDEDYLHVFPIENKFFLAGTNKEEFEYNKLYNWGLNHVLYVKRTKAREVWDLMMKHAWKSAEPGILFWDKIIEESPADCYEGFETTSTNPCGEIPLCPYDSCRLLSINMFGFIENPFTPEAYINWNKFKEVSYLAQKLMDDIVDLEQEKIIQIMKKIGGDKEPHSIKSIELNLWSRILDKLSTGRRTGLSVIGIGDALAALGKKYDEENDLVEKIYKILALESYKASIDMAKERDAFPMWKYETEVNNVFIKRIMENLSEQYQKAYKKYGRRNIANLTIPPSGSLAILAQITSGIEPAFSLYYTRRRKVDKTHHKIDFTDQNGDCWEEYKVFHPKFKDWFYLNWQNILDEDPNLLPNYKPSTPPVLENYSKEQIDKIIEKSPYYKATANEIDPISKIKMQGKVQKWIDHSISVTHNLPQNITVEEVSNIYKIAYESGCKGCTIYRDGSRSGVLVTEDKPKENKIFDFEDAYKRPKDLECHIHPVTVKGEAYIVLVGILNNKPYEVFALKQNGYDVPKIKIGYLSKVKKGYYNLLNKNKEILIDNVISHFERPIDEAITRLVSTSLRHRTHIKYIVEQLNKTPSEINDFSKVIARTLKKYIKDNESSTENCPVCSLKLSFQNGCVECKGCGFTQC